MRIIVIISIFFGSAGFSQISLLNTNTSSDLTELILLENYLLVNGSDSYLSKYYYNTDTIIEIPSPTPSGYTQSDVSVIDSNYYFLSAHTEFPHHGIIYRSSNGGNSWLSILDTTDILFGHFSMFDSLSGVVISTFYKTLYTFNNGETWNSGSHGLIMASTLLKVNDSVALVGTIEGFNYTINKGQSWIGDPGFCQSPPRAFFATNLDTIYSITEAFFTYTLDLVGSNWVEKQLPAGFSGIELYVKSSSEIYIVGQDINTQMCRIIKTTDLGNSWLFYDPGIPGAIYDIEFVNDSIAIIAGSNGLLAKWDSQVYFEMLGNSEISSQHDNLKIYPNPAVNYIQMSSDPINNSTYLCLVIVDMTGKVIEEYNNILPLERVDISQLNSGFYIFEIYSNGMLVEQAKVAVN